MLPDRVSNPGPPIYESGVLPIALRGPASAICNHIINIDFFGREWLEILGNGADSRKFESKCGQLTGKHNSVIRIIFESGKETVVKREGWAPLP